MRGHALRIRLEPIQITDLPRRRPVYHDGAVVYEVADAVEADLALIHLDCLDAVRVMTQYEIGAGIDRGMRDWWLVVADRFRDVVLSPVYRHNYDVRILLCF